MPIDPMFIAISVGIVIYFLAVSVLPKDYLQKTKYTTKQLKILKGESDIDTSFETSLLLERYQSTGLFDKAFYILPFSNIFHPYIVKAGIEKKVGILFITCIIAFEVSLFVLAGKVGISLFMAMITSIFFAYIVGFLFVSSAIKKRMKKFMTQFPDALDTIVRSVVSGFPINAAINVVHESMESPIKDEFKLVSELIAHGSTLVDALDRMAIRLGVPDVRFFAVVLTLQQEVGGNLAETLSNLSGLLRKRRMMRLKIAALTSEGRASGWVLGLLPVLVGCAVNFTTPSYLVPLFTTSTGHIILIAAITSIGIGVGVVRLISNIEV